MHFPFPRHDHTPHVRLDPRACAACGACVKACTRGVLSMLPYAFHRHVHVDNPNRCKGCLRCVAACRHGAIKSLQRLARTPPGLR